MPSIAIRPSSRNLSMTPHPKAPWAPPPCNARLMVFVGLGEERLEAALDFGAMNNTCWLDRCFSLLNIGDRPKFWSVRGPSAIDRNVRTGDGRSRVGAQEHSDAGNLFRGDELLGRLRRQQHIPLHRFLGDATCLGRIRY